MDGRRGSMVAPMQAAMAVEQQRRKRRSTGRSRSRWHAKRAGGGERADRDGDARCKRPGARPAGQGKEGKDIPYLTVCTYSRKGSGPWLLPVRRHRVAIINSTYILEVNQSHRRKLASGVPNKRARERRGKACRLPCSALPDSVFCNLSSILSLPLCCAAGLRQRRALLAPLAEGRDAELHVAGCRRKRYPWSVSSRGRREAFDRCRVDWS